MLNNITLKDFEKAIKKLEEVLALKKDEIIRDSAIKRFELCFDLSWKTVKNYAKTEGLECYSPKECFKSAFQLKLIDKEKEWLEMVNDRNLSIHLYNEDKAEEIYSRLSAHLKMFKQLFKKINS